MQKFDMVAIEVGLHEWSALTCGCGRSASHIPADFQKALESPPPARTGEGWAEGHAYVQSNLMQPAVATTSLVMASLADGGHGEHRRQLFIVLATLVNGEQDDVADSCLEVVKRGSWVLYEEIASGRDVDSASYAFEVLALVDDEAVRLDAFRQIVAINLPSDLR
ncbi:hypothetical protein [Streptomyces sp. NPDC057336]|uniref:hypothetical protein n=1 Tax=Streptomyces sp. NPDC057336 TaxID=3346102 RepID=UPI0036353D42